MGSRRYVGTPVLRVGLKYNPGVKICVSLWYIVECVVMYVGGYPGCGGMDCVFVSVSLVGVLGELFWLVPCWCQFLLIYIFF